jgi:hypothetical protein
VLRKRCQARGVLIVQSLVFLEDYPRLGPAGPDLTSRLEPAGIVQGAWFDTHNACKPVAIGDVEHPRSAVSAKFALHGLPARERPLPLPQFARQGLQSLCADP